jgi:hypothetical protein
MISQTILTPAAIQCGASKCPAAGVIDSGGMAIGSDIDQRERREPAADNVRFVSDRSRLAPVRSTHWFDNRLRLSLVSKQ